MNPIKLEEDCKKEGRKCFENFKHHLLNYPFDSKIDTDAVANVIVWEIDMKFGANVLKNHISGNESKVQMDMICNKVEEFKKIITTICWNWARKEFELE